MKHMSIHAETAFINLLGSESNIVKYAESGPISSLIEAASSYFSNKIDPDNKTASILSLLAPTAVYGVASALGLNWIAKLLGVATAVFQIEIKDILQNIFNNIKPSIESGTQFTSNQLSTVVSNAFSVGNTFESKSFDMQMREVVMFKIAINKIADDKKPFLAFPDLKGKTLTILARVFFWIFKVALSSAGFMAAGEGINKLLGRPNVIDKTQQDGKAVDKAKVEMQNAIPSASKAVTTKFKLNPAYIDESLNMQGTVWSENVPNNSSSIKNLVMSFVTDVYDVNQYKSQIQNLPLFRVICSNIEKYNRTPSEDNIVFIPKTFKSKKALADVIVEELAKTIA